ncbi:MAG: tRNA lysidine(34) synthetase TilS [Synechococcaceae cyanobacterium RL_1_2]|nr:tRNA lysidine(34) synthetase TilS [Synechococcaceae cyanobacterium RL_1_2]
MKTDRDWGTTHAQLQGLLKRHQWLPSHSRILIALSGGQDSLCLTKLLRDLQPHWSWFLAIAHCDHGWQGDQGIADHVKSLAEGVFELPYYLRYGHEIKETEAAARAWRYETLQEIARGEDFGFVVTGHTQSDRAETLLLNLLRGSGAQGLGAMAPVRPLSDRVLLVRPLLHLHRSQTAHFCEQYGLPIWEDGVNQNLKYARNRVRLELLPYLKQHFNSQVESHLSHSGEILQAEAAYLDEVATRHYQMLCPQPDRLERQGTHQLPIALQRRVIIKFIQGHSSKTLGFEQVESIRYLLGAPQRSRTSSLPGGLVVAVAGDYLRVNGS